MRSGALLFSITRIHVIHVLLPLAVGSTLYIIGRKTTNLVADHMVELPSVPSHVQLPDWVIYNLPDGLWLYSFLMWLILTWKEVSGLQPILWYLLLVVGSLSSELLQKWNIIRGTYDTKDILAYAIAIVACLYNQFKLSKE